ncbi:MAG: cyclic nucleotide-binding domain-containing protein [Candidatus Latescibacteria bacterium]|nr:cyclic nucleotide-binding domain-containing protein [Candidatus Latescibacterota bacterium]
MESTTFTLEYALWAFLLGGFSAVSLPMGSMLGIVWKPKPGITASLTAFGAGALLAALSVELVAPTVMAVVGQGGEFATGDSHQGDAVVSMVSLLAGSIAGGILFVILDHLLNSKGGYLRKAATTITYLRQRRKKQIEQMLHRLGHIEFFRSIPPERVRMLVDYVRPVSFDAGEKLFDAGDEGDRMYFIEQGAIALSVNGDEFKTLGAGDVLGEIALLTGAPRTAQAVARHDTVAFELLKEDFDKLRDVSPELEAATKQIASQRLDELQQHHDRATDTAAAQWAQQAAETLHGAALPTVHEVRLAAQEHGGAPLAIWLGIFLDGIPESFVIGAGFLAILTAKLAYGAPALTAVIPYTLIAGLFLSNFPEAMSSSIGMKDQGWKAPKILMLWVSLMVMTAIGAVVGYSIGAEVEHTVVVGIEGMAAGAMLTMIAQTMIPEAVHLGGPNVVGLSTLAGFLSAVAFKLLEA